MFKRLMFLTVISLFVACSSNAPRQKPLPSEPYIVLSSMADPTSKSYRIMIRIDSPASEDRVKKAVDMLVEKHKGQFEALTINSYTTSDTNTPPYAVSRYDSSGVSHQFNAQVAPQKIPSH
jgi:hypothetical protein